MKPDIMDLIDALRWRRLEQARELARILLVCDRGPNFRAIRVLETAGFVVVIPYIAGDPPPRRGIIEYDEVSMTY
jgi:hypothetical protein